MSDVLVQLHKDHVNIMRLLDLMEAQLGLFREGERPDYGLMLDIMQYMTSYPDLFHHPKEDLMFRRLTERDPGARLVVKDLINKHVVLADQGAQLLASLQNVVNDVMIERDVLESQGRAYIETLRHHMDVEEGQVFPLAQELLLPEDWAAIDEEMQAMDDPLFGEVVAQDYATLYDYIKRASE